FLQMKRPGEAKVALTACIGQRPRCCWSHLFRGEAQLQLADLVAAAQDFQTASERKANAPLRQKIDEAVAMLGQSVALLLPPQRQAFWNAKITTMHGQQALQHAILFDKLKKS